MELGRYEIGRILGQGGAGTVYEALLQGPGGYRMPVALKLLHEPARSLEREARLGGLLRHVHLVDVYEIGEHEGRWFCALERCDGSLADHVPLPPRAVVDVGLQVCAALAYAQDALGLVHLDLKPENLLHKDGLVKVSDLGVARARGFDSHGGVSGTPGYMAPELLEGRPVDARADVYALGVTLIELATSIRPSASTTVDYTSIGPLDAPAADGPAWLAPIVERCLASDPAERWPDMDALARALGELEVDGPSLREVLGVTLARPLPVDPLADLPVLVGRERALAEVAAALDEPGLLTLWGPAGIGKSSLAFAAAHRFRQAGAPTFVCPLAEVRDRDGLLLAVAAALEVAADEAQIGHALAARDDALLLLDDFDQLVALAPVLERWSARASLARFLVTSRTLLRTGTERVVEVKPLDPHASETLLAARARERGAEVGGDVALAELAARLDGLPLALELAAGRIGVLSVREVVDRLGPELLRAADPGRQGTLEAALDWSWSLLPETEQRALAQLSVFAGGFSLPAAEEVLDLAGASVVDAVASLLDRALVRAHPSGRFGLLETIRTFGRARLEDPLPVEARHGRFFARFGHPAATSEFQRSGRLPGVERPLDELENLRAACARAVARGDGVVAVETLIATLSISLLHGFTRQVYELSLAVAALPLTDELAARAELAAGSFARFVGAVDQAGPRLERARELARASGAVSLGARIELQLAGALRQQGRHADARELLQHCIATRRSTGDLAGVAEGRAALGIVWFELASFEEARACWAEAAAGHRRLGNPRAAAAALGNLGLALRNLGRRDEALACFEEALALHREAGDKRAEAQVMSNLGIERMRMGRPEARELFERSLALLREGGNRWAEAATLNNLAVVELHRGARGRARERLEEAVRVGREAGNLRSVTFALCELGSLADARGDLAEAARLAEEALALARRVGLDERAAAASYQLGRALMMQGRLTEGRAALAEALDLARARELRWVEARSRLALAVGRGLEGDLGAAGAEIAALTAALPADPQGDRIAMFLLARAEAWRLLGDPGKAQASVEAAAERVPAWRVDLLGDIEAFRAM